MLMSDYTISNIWASEQRFSFSVLADPRSQGETWKNALMEIRDGNAKNDSAFMPAELIIVAGDMGPIKSRYEEYQNVFTDTATRPVFLPVIGIMNLKMEAFTFDTPETTLSWPYLVRSVDIPVHVTII